MNNISFMPIPNYLIQNGFKELSMGHNEVTVYLFLCANINRVGNKHTNKSFGYAWPSQKTISDKTGLNMRTVSKNIKLLQENKIITKTIVLKSQGGWTRYSYLMVQPEELLKRCNTQRMNIQGALRAQKKSMQVDAGYNEDYHEKINEYE